MASANKDAKEQNNENENDSDENNAASSEESEDEHDLKASGEKFEVHFEKSLFEPPKIIKTTHAKLEAIAKSQ
jgi:hypothetical protein